MSENSEPDLTTLTNSGPTFVAQGDSPESSTPAAKSQLPTHHHGDADTQRGAMREFLTMWVNSTYLWASVIETVVPSTFQKTPVGYTVPALVGGAVVALGVAYGSAKIQQALDAFNENPPEFNGENLPSYQSKQPDAGAATLIGALTQKIELFLTDNKKLTKKQVAQLALAMVGQMGDLVGFGIGMLNADTSPLTKPEKMVSNLVIMSAGLGASWAAIRPSSNTMKFMNENAHNVKHGHSDPNQKPDGWTKLFLLVKVFQTGIANVSFYGSIADKMNGYKSDTPFGTSKQGILETILPIFLVTAGVTFFQYFISTVNQGHYRPHENNTNSPENSNSTESSNSNSELKDNDLDSVEMGSRVANTDDSEQKESESLKDEQSISSLEKFSVDVLLWLRMAGTGTDCSQPVLYMLNDYMSSYIYLSTAIASTGVGMWLSRSDCRTSKESWNTFRMKNQESISGFFNAPYKAASRSSACLSSFFKDFCSSQSELKESLMEHADSQEESIEDGRRVSFS